MCIRDSVSGALALPGALALGIGEMVGAVLILVPRFRRWGALLLGLLLVVFMVYIGANYGTLVGKDCTCFPLVKRAINPAFFFEDGAMLLMAALAGIWARSSENLRGALVILGAVVVFAGVSFGVNNARAVSYTHLDVYKRQVSRRVALMRVPEQSWSNKLVAFRVNLPALEHFPTGVWSMLINRHSRRPTRQFMAYGDALGYMPLREACLLYTSRCV